MYVDDVQKNNIMTFVFNSFSRESCVECCCCVRLLERKGRQEKRRNVVGQANPIRAGKKTPHYRATPPHLQAQCAVHKIIFVSLSWKETNAGGWSQIAKEENRLALAESHWKKQQKKCNKTNDMCVLSVEPRPYRPVSFIGIIVAILFCLVFVSFAFNVYIIFIYTLYGNSGIVL